MRTPTPSPAGARRTLSAADQELLDTAFEDALESWESGRPSSPAELLASRPDLWDVAEGLLSIVRDVAVVGPSAPEQARVPGYAILRELGRGSMGTVYLASQETLGGRLVALKVLPASAISSSRSRDRFRAEAHAVARLRHPHIVTVYEVVQDERVLAYAMEPVDGPAFQTVIDHMSGLSHLGTKADVRAFLGAGESALGDEPWWMVVARVGEAIAQALTAVHEAGLVHRDVKPSNILLRRDGTPLLTDFGLVRDPASPVQTVTNDFVGTAAYAPPEQLVRGTDQLDARADIYALGATLFHAFCGRRPHDGRSPLQLLDQASHGVEGRPELRGAPRDFRTIITKAMAPQANDRYQSAAAMGDDLRRLIESRPIEARPTGLLRRAALLARRRRQMVWGIAGGTLATALLVVFLVFAFAVLPRWSREASEEAWLTLLDPRDTVTLANAGFFEDPGLGPPRMDGEVVRLALDGYDRADQFGMASAQSRLERDVLRMARAWLDEGVPRFSERLRRRAPQACAWFEHWCQVPGDQPPGQLDFESLSNDELVAVGMMSYLTWYAVPATRAWLELERRGQANTFMHAGLGLYFLYALRPDAAYPRIRDADLRLPGIAYLRAAHAEAALFAGEINRAEWLYDEATRLPRQDPSQMKRVGLLLDRARGRTGGLIQCIQSQDFESSVAAVQFAPWLTELGLYEIAAKSLGKSMRGPSGPHVKRAMVRSAQLWWDTLPRADREGAVREALVARPRVRAWMTQDIFRHFHVAKAALRARGGEAWDLVCPHPLEAVCEKLSPVLPSEEESLPFLVPPTDEEVEAIVRDVLGP